MSRNFSQTTIRFFLHDNKQLVLIVLVSVFSLMRERNAFIDQVNEAACNWRMP